MKHSKAYVLYANENYFDLISVCAKSIRTFSELPIYIYLLNSDKKVEISNTITLKWDCDIDIDETEEMYVKQDDLNFYVNRASKRIYRLIKERPLVVKDALKYADNVAYIDCDSVVTPYIDKIFELFNQHSFYPFFTEGIYDFLMMNGRGGADRLDDLSNTLEHPACNLLSINQYNRKKYRTSNLFVAGKNCIEWLEEWYWLETNPKILNDPEFYAPFQDETIANCLLWKYNFQAGLPYIYTNASLDKIDLIYNELGFTGNDRHISNWFKLPAYKEYLLAFHGEKRIDIMEQMIEKLKNI
jgi:hypothetical protein